MGELKAAVGPKATVDDIPDDVLNECVTPSGPSLHRAEPHETLLPAAETWDPCRRCISTQADHVVSLRFFFASIEACGFDYVYMLGVWQGSKQSLSRAMELSAAEALKLPAPPLLPSVPSLPHPLGTYRIPSNPHRKQCL